MELISMEDASPLECTVARRLKRFVVEVEAGGHLKRACINNTGRLKGCLDAGKTGFCIPNRRPGKTSYRLFAVKDGEQGAIIDTQLQMRSFESALMQGAVPWLDRCAMLKRNACLGNSLIDYLLTCGPKPVYLEVKSAVLREGRHAMYPDCPTKRGRKHIGELTAHRAGGGEAVILFIAALPEVHSFKPSREGDPELCDLLLVARDMGVEIRAMAMAYNPQTAATVLYNENLPVEL